MAVTRDSNGNPVAFTDLPADAFPITIRFRLDADDGRILWERVVEPYQYTEIPAMAEEYRGRSWLEMIFGNGERITMPPMTPEEATTHIESEIEETRRAEMD